MPNHQPLDQNSVGRSPWWTVLLFFAALLSHWTGRYHFQYYHSDHLHQIAATQAMIDGHGYSLSDVDADDLSGVKYSFLDGFPPGLSLLLFPLLKLTGDPWWSSLALDAIVITVFLAAWLSILTSLRGSLPSAAVVFLLAYWAIAYSPLTALYSADMLAYAMYSSFIALTLRALEGGKWGAALAVAAGLLLGATYAIRYAYLPVIGTSILFTVAFGAIYARSQMRTSLLIAVVSGLAFVAAGLFRRMLSSSAGFLPGYAGSPGYLDADVPDAGPFWDQLLLTYPFPAEALGISRIGFALEKRGYVAYEPMLLVMWGVSAVVLWALIVRVRPFIAPYVASSVQRQLPAIFFHGCQVLVGTVTVVMLSYMTWKHPAADEVWTTRGWVASSEPRYFLPAFGFLIVPVAAYLFDNGRGRNPGRALLAGIVIASAALCLMANAYQAVLAAKPLWRGGQSSVPRFTTETNDVLYAAISENRVPDVPAVSLALSGHGSPIVRLAGAAPLRGMGVDQLKDIQTHKAVQLFLIVDDSMFRAETVVRQFIADHEGELVSETPEFSIFSMMIRP